jgi:hypothetical protein
VLAVGGGLFLIAVAAGAPMAAATSPPTPAPTPTPAPPRTPTTRTTPTPDPAPPQTPTGAAAEALLIRSGRTTTVVASVDVGTPIEREIPNATYTRAATADADERWEDAQPLYRQAIAEWTATARTRSSRALELAIAKAEHELRSSQILGIAARSAQPPIRRAKAVEDAQRSWQRRQALDDGRLLSAKLLATRATLGRVSATLYIHARNRLEEARDAQAGPPVGAGAGLNATIELSLCATYAAGDAAADARLARARVTEAEREDPANTLEVAACAAALGETEAALSALERFVLRPVPARPDRLLRDIYLANDWDHLRGNPRFESLFR